MRLPWQPREYERTCVECGYTWQVPRSVPRRRFSTINTYLVARPTNVDRAELAREVSSISAANQSAEALRHCPKCGADHFTQNSRSARR